MPRYCLSIVMSGTGDDRSHRGLIYHAPGADLGNLMHVLFINRTRLWYQLDKRSGVAILSAGAEGYFTIAELDEPQLRLAYTTVRGEDAPRDRVERCQDWIQSCIMAVKAEELVHSGLSE